MSISMTGTPGSRTVEVEATADRRNRVVGVGIVDAVEAVEAVGWPPGGDGGGPPDPAVGESAGVVVVVDAEVDKGLDAGVDPGPSAERSCPDAAAGSTGAADIIKGMLTSTAAIDLHNELDLQNDRCPAGNDHGLVEVL